MAILSKGTTFATGNQVTAANLNAFPLLVEEVVDYYGVVFS